VGTITGEALGVLQLSVRRSRAARNLLPFRLCVPWAPPGSPTACRILHNFFTFSPHKRDQLFVLLSYFSFTLVMSADDDGRVARLPFTDSWVVQAACFCTTHIVKEKGGTTLPQRQLYHCHLDLTRSAELDCDPDTQLASELRLAYQGKAWSRSTTSARISRRGLIGLGVVVLRGCDSRRGREQDLSCLLPPPPSARAEPLAQRPSAANWTTGRRDGRDGTPRRRTFSMMNAT
jgi:hypothetical protein